MHGAAGSARARSRCHSLRAPSRCGKIRRMRERVQIAIVRRILRGIAGIGKRRALVPVSHLRFVPGFSDRLHYIRIGDWRMLLFRTGGWRGRLWRHDRLRSSRRLHDWFCSRFNLRRRRLHYGLRHRLNVGLWPWDAQFRLRRLGKLDLFGRGELKRHHEVARWLHPRRNIDQRQDKHDQRMDHDGTRERLPHPERKPVPPRRPHHWKDGRLNW